MIVRSFVDTNVFVYADDPRDPFKQSPCHGTGRRRACAPRLGVVSTQVLQEYFNAATRKLRLDGGRSPAPRSS